MVRRGSPGTERMANSDSQPADGNRVSVGRLAVREEQITESRLGASLQARTHA